MSMPRREKEPDNVVSGAELGLSDQEAMRTRQRCREAAEKRRKEQEGRKGVSMPLPIGTRERKGG